MSTIEQYFITRAKRLALAAEVAVLEQEEKDILYELTRDLLPSDTKYTEVNDGYRFTATRKDSVLVRDWSLLLPYVQATGELDLLQRRVTESAVKARWEDGKELPGIERGIKWDVKVTKEA